MHDDCESTEEILILETEFNSLSLYGHIGPTFGPEHLSHEFYNLDSGLHTHNIHAFSLSPPSVD